MDETYPKIYSNQSKSPSVTTTQKKTKWIFRIRNVKNTGLKEMQKTKESDADILLSKKWSDAGIS